MKNLIKINLLFVIVTALTSCSSPGTFTEEERELSLSTLKNTGVMGASMSAGFMLDIKFADVLDKSFLSEHKLMSVADAGFFQDPVGIGKNMIDALKDNKSTLIFAVDFLFWFAHGSGLSFADRTARLDKGLKLLDSIECAVIVGTLPDMSGANKLMLPPSAIPSKDELEKINAKIANWSKTNKKIILVPLSDWVYKMKNSKEIEIFGEKKIFPTDDVMQADMLHPSKKGLIVVTILCIQELLKNVKGFSNNDFCADFDQLLSMLPSK